MPFVPFDLERWQSEWEHTVRFNLSESGVHPLSLEELLTISATQPDALGDIALGYSQTNGTGTLRTSIAQLYEGADADNVLVTVGSSEANFLVTWALGYAGRSVAVQVPTYMQTWGVATSLGANVTTFPLRQERERWRLDEPAMREAVTGNTDLIVVTNPNNPTGHMLTPAERDLIVGRASETGSWLLVDEVYRGAERMGTTTPSLWGATNQTVVTGGLSKAYGLPGLRIGWIIANHDFIHQAVERHDYTVIGPSAISDFLAIRALTVRGRLLERTRAIVSANYAIIDDWLRSFGDLFEWVAPGAGAICYARYGVDVGALDLVEHLRVRHNVLLVPGEHFHAPRHLRFGYGLPADELRGALSATAHGLRDLIGD